jgi:hypothetical protein
MPSYFLQSIEKSSTHTLHATVKCYPEPYGLRSDEVLCMLQLTEDDDTPTNNASWEMHFDKRVHFTPQSTFMRRSHHRPTPEEQTNSFRVEATHNTVTTLCQHSTLPLVESRPSFPAPAPAPPPAPPPPPLLLLLPATVSYSLPTSETSCTDKLHSTREGWRDSDCQSGPCWPPACGGA